MRIFSASIVAPLVLVAVGAGLLLWWPSSVPPRKMDQRLPQVDAGPKKPAVVVDWPGEFIAGPGAPGEAAGSKELVGRAMVGDDRAVGDVAEQARGGPLACSQCALPSALGSGRDGCGTGPASSLLVIR